MELHDSRLELASLLTYKAVTVSHSIERLQSRSVFALNLTIPKSKRFRFDFFVSIVETISLGTFTIPKSKCFRLGVHDSKAELLPA